MQTFLANELEDKLKALDPLLRQEVKKQIELFKLHPDFLPSSEQKIGETTFVRKQGRWRIYVTRALTQNGVMVAIILDIVDRDEINSGNALARWLKYRLDS